MSDALNFLVNARPEAMSAYFTFLKDAGSRLDPKTRNLISVITKVHAQTANGLRQYLKRALREGASAEEVVDALLMAFPALGLAKIVWAIDVILKMDLPEFKLAFAAGSVAKAGAAPGTVAGGAEAPSPASSAPAWHDVAAVASLRAGKTLRLECDGRGLFVYGKGTKLKVYDALCPHQATRIPELALAGDTLTCPKHEWCFDVTTGACTAKGDRPLRELPHKIESGRLLVHW